MTQADRYQAVVQGGKIIKKEMVAKDMMYMDSVMEFMLMQQADKLKYSEKNPRALINIEYFDVKKVNCVYDRKGKMVSFEKGDSQDEDLSKEQKAKAGRQRPARPSDEEEKK